MTSSRPLTESKCNRPVAASSLDVIFGTSSGKRTQNYSSSRLDKMRMHHSSSNSSTCTEKTEPLSPSLSNHQHDHATASPSTTTRTATTKNGWKLREAFNASPKGRSSSNNRSMKRVSSQSPSQLDGRRRMNRTRSDDGLSDILVPVLPDALRMAAAAAASSPTKQTKGQATTSGPTMASKRKKNLPPVEDTVSSTSRRNSGGSVSTELQQDQQHRRENDVVAESPSVEDTSEYLSLSSSHSRTTTSSSDRRRSRSEEPKDLKNRVWSSSIGKLSSSAAAGGSEVPAVENAKYSKSSNASPSKNLKNREGGNSKAIQNTVEKVRSRSSSVGKYKKKELNGHSKQVSQTTERIRIKKGKNHVEEEIQQHTIYTLPLRDEYDEVPCAGNTPKDEALLTTSIEPNSVRSWASSLTPSILDNSFGSLCFEDKDDDDEYHGSISNEGSMCLSTDSTFLQSHPFLHDDEVKTAQPILASVVGLSSAFRRKEESGESEPSYNGNHTDLTSGGDFQKQPLRRSRSSSSISIQKQLSQRSRSKKRDDDDANDNTTEESLAGRKGRKRTTSTSPTEPASSRSSTSSGFHKQPLQRSRSSSSISYLKQVRQSSRERKIKDDDDDGTVKSRKGRKRTPCTNGANTELPPAFASISPSKYKSPRSGRRLLPSTSAPSTNTVPNDASASTDDAPTKGPSHDCHVTESHDENRTRSMTPTRFLSRTLSSTLKKILPLPLRQQQQQQNTTEDVKKEGKDDTTVLFDADSKSAKVDAWKARVRSRWGEMNDQREGGSVSTKDDDTDGPAGPSLSVSSKHEINDRNTQCSGTKDDSTARKREIVRMSNMQKPRSKSLREDRSAAKEALRARKRESVSNQRIPDGVDANADADTIGNDGCTNNRTITNDEQKAKVVERHQRKMTRCTSLDTGSDFGLTYPINQDSSSGESLGDKSSHSQSSSTNSNEKGVSKLRMKKDAYLQNHQKHEAMIGPSSIDQEEILVGTTATATPTSAKHEIIKSSQQYQPPTKKIAPRPRCLRQPNKLSKWQIEQEHSKHVPTALHGLYNRRLDDDDDDDDDDGDGNNVNEKLIPPAFRDSNRAAAKQCRREQRMQERQKIRDEIAEHHRLLSSTNNEGSNRTNDVASGNNETSYTSHREEGEGFD
jgi:hypothetical protein